MSEYIERLDLNKIRYLLSLDRLHDNPKKEAGQRSYLTNYLKLYNNGLIVSYDTIQKWKGFGRLYSYNKKVPVGLMWFSKDIRSFLSEGLYIDIDLKKCHWYILRHLFCKYDFDFRLIDNLLDRYEQIKDYIVNELHIQNFKGGMFAILNTTERFMSVNSKLILDSIEELQSIYKIVYGGFIKLLKIDNPELYKLVQKNATNPENIDGCFIASFLQDFEKQLITQIVNDAIDYDINVVSIQHDGCMVMIEDKPKLDLFFEFIYNKYSKIYTGLKPILVIKPLAPHSFTDYKNGDEMSSVDLNYLFDTEDDYEFMTFRNEVRSRVFESYENLNEYCYKNLPRVIYPLDEPSGFIYKVSTDDLKMVRDIPLCYLYYKNPKGDEESITLTKYIKSPDFHKHLTPLKRVVFEPNSNKVNMGEFNMFSGLQARRVDEVDMDLIQPILHHIKTCWCSDNDDLFDYTLQWFRHSVKFPGKKTGINLVLQGAQGAGKGLLFQDLFIPYIFGDKVCAKTHGLEPVVQRFNSVCMNKLFICCDEVSTEGLFHHHWEKMKSLTTEYKMLIELKGIDAFHDYNNYIDFCFLMNGTDGIKVEQRDRRMFVLSVSDRYVEDWEYMGRLSNTCNQETANHLYTYLINLPETRQIRQIPMTDLKRDMMLTGMSSVEKFYNDVIENKEQIITRTTDSLLDYGKWDWVVKRYIDNGKIQSRYLFEAYSKWCHEMSETKKSNTQFGKKMKTLCERVKTRSSNSYKLW